MGKRRLSREVALQATYLLDVSTKLNAQEAFDTVRTSKEDLDEKSAAFTWELAQGLAPPPKKSF